MSFCDPVTGWSKCGALSFTGTANLSTGIRSLRALLEAPIALHANGWRARFSGEFWRYVHGRSSAYLRPCCTSTPSRSIFHSLDSLLGWGPELFRPALCGPRPEIVSQGLLVMILCSFVLRWVSKTLFSVHLLIKVVCLVVDRVRLVKVWVVHGKDPHRAVARNWPSDSRGL